MRWIPFLVMFALGFVVAALLFRRPAGGGADGWRAKYQDLLARYRDLSRRIGEDDKSEVTSRRASRYRQTLWDVRGMLQRPDGLSPDRARRALDEIDAALEE